MHCQDCLNDSANLGVSCGGVQEGWGGFWHSVWMKLTLWLLFGGGHSNGGGQLAVHFRHLVHQDLLLPEDWGWGGGGLDKIPDGWKFCALCVGEGQALWMTIFFHFQEGLFLPPPP